MCTPPRQLLPSVFGGDASPRGLRRTLKLLTCPAAADNHAATLMVFCIRDRFRRENTFPRFFWLNVGVCVCRPALVKTPTLAKTSSSWHGSSALLGSAAESSPGHLSLHPWRWTDCVPERVPSFSGYHSHYILQGYSITVTSSELHIHRLQHFVRLPPSSQMTPHNPGSWILDHAEDPEWPTRPNPAESSPLTDPFLLLFGSSLSSRVKSTLLLMDAVEMTQPPTAAPNICCSFFSPRAIASSRNLGLFSRKRKRDLFGSWAWREARTVSHNCCVWVPPFPGCISVILRPRIYAAPLTNASLWTLFFLLASYYLRWLLCWLRFTRFGETLAACNTPNTYPGFIEV